MKKEDEYLRRASEAQKWADQAKSDKARAGWLRIAQNWMELVRGHSIEAFKRSAESRGTSQEDSTASP